MEQAELLRHLVETLERLGVRYLVTGSVATIFYGEPRLTNDIDVVVALPSGKVKSLCQSFPFPEYYVDEGAVHTAVETCGQFNIIHPTSGLKIDVVVPADTAFNRSRFARVMRVKPTSDYDASFASAEDVIVKKMEYYREGGSEKHLGDIVGVLRISGDQIDRAYIADWAQRLGLSEIWRTILKRLDA